MGTKGLGDRILYVQQELSQLSLLLAPPPIKKWTQGKEKNICLQHLTKVTVACADF